MRTVVTTCWKHVVKGGSVKKLNGEIGVLLARMEEMEETAANLKKKIKDDCIRFVKKIVVKLQQLSYVKPYLKMNSVSGM